MCAGPNKTRRRRRTDPTPRGSCTRASRARPRSSWRPMVVAVVVRAWPCARWWCRRRGGTRCASEAGAGRDWKRVAWLLRGEERARASRGSSRRGGRGGSRWGDDKLVARGGRRGRGRGREAATRATAALSLEQSCRHHSSSSSRHLRASTSSTRRLACVHLVPPLPSSLSLSSSILISLTPRLHHHTARAPDLPRSGADKGRPPDPGPRLHRPLLGPVRPSSPPPLPRQPSAHSTDARTHAAASRASRAHASAVARRPASVRPLPPPPLSTASLPRLTPLSRRSPANCVDRFLDSSLFIVKSLEERKGGHL